MIALWLTHHWIWVFFILSLTKRAHIFMQARANTQPEKKPTRAHRTSSCTRNRAAHRTHFFWVRELLLLVLYVVSVGAIVASRRKQSRCKWAMRFAFYFRLAQPRHMWLNACRPYALYIVRRWWKDGRFSGRFFWGVADMWTWMYSHFPVARNQEGACWRWWRWCAKCGGRYRRRTRMCRS